MAIMIRHRIARVICVLISLAGLLFSRSRATAGEFTSLSIKELLKEPEKSLEEFIRPADATKIVNQVDLRGTAKLPKMPLAKNSNQDGEEIVDEGSFKRKENPNSQKIIDEIKIQDLSTHYFVFEKISEEKPHEKIRVIDPQNSSQISAKIKPDTIAVRVSIPEGSIEEHGVRAEILDNDLENITKAGDSGLDIFTQVSYPKIGLERDGSVRFVEEPGGAKFVPQTIVLRDIGEKVVVSLPQSDGQAQQIYLRHHDIVDWDQTKRELMATAQGETELYFVYRRKMHILRVKVQADNAQKSLDLPNGLVNYDGPSIEKNADVASFSDGASNLSPFKAFNHQQAISLNSKPTESERKVTESQESVFKLERDQTRHTQVTLQVIDDRSDPFHAKIYPAANVEVHVLGTEFYAKTDQTGYLYLRDVPINSRFYLALQDQDEKFAPAIAEISTFDSKPEISRIRVLRSFVLDTYRAIAQSDSSTMYASLCGTLIDENEQVTAGQTSVGLDVSALGPYYFNRFGILDASQVQSGQDGRFCFFNVLPGPVSIRIFQDGDVIGAVSSATFGGQHSEISIFVGSDKVTETRLAMLPTAHQQLSTDIKAANSINSVDMIDLIPLGYDDPMSQRAPGLVSAAYSTRLAENRIWAFAQAAEFDPVIYSYDRFKRRQITPLLPRGFIEDMSYYAQIIHDPSLGAVVVDYSGTSSGSLSGINFKLVDALGRKISEPWYFADQPTNKAIFFNVPVGAYSLIAESGDAYLLAADTLLVFSETATYIQMGGKITYSHD